MSLVVNITVSEEPDRGDVNQYAEEQLAWHKAMKHELMDILNVTDPAAIVPMVRRLVHNQGD